ncbi:MAG: S1 RNA-binding domain-containing protein [Anaerolineales bacterium]|nr:S1 RNA-binding domain-containing protein [Anaerolineales bacterium]
MEKQDSPNGAQSAVEGGSRNEEVHPMNLLMEEESIGFSAPRRGEIRTGTIARITESDILVDIGAKSEGVIPRQDVDQLPEEEQEKLVEGAEISVYIQSLGQGDHPIRLSLHRAIEEKDWLEAETLRDSKDPYESTVAGFNKGGLIVKLGRLRGFIPASQISLSRRKRSEGETPDKRWGKMVGEPIVTRIIEVDRNRNRLILSERAAAREARDILKERLIDELEEGEVRTGHVISLADFGVFVDIGGADGLVHLSEISWKRINHPNEVLSVGDEVQVRVLSVDSSKKRISLSIRDLQPDPWEMLENTFVEGQLVEGTITKLTKFGAFASLVGMEEFDVEGLIHISELAERHITHPKEVVAEGDRLALRVIKIDIDRRRIGLSLKKVDSPAFAEMDWQTAMKEIKSEDEGEAAGPQDEAEEAAEVSTVATAAVEPEAPAPEEPGEEEAAPDKAEVEEAEVDETEVDETEVDETEVDETEVDETEVDETEVDETEVEEAAAEEAVTEEAEVEEAEVEEAEVEEAGAEEVEVEGTEETPADEAVEKNS